MFVSIECSISSQSEPAISPVLYILSYEGGCGKREGGREGGRECGKREGEREGERVQ